MTPPMSDKSTSQKAKADPKATAGPTVSAAKPKAAKPDAPKAAAKPKAEAPRSEPRGKAKTHSFQAEVTQLLQLMINSLYSEREIFLRELIANAADACDRLRFLALTDKKLFEDDTDLRVQISCDADNNTITIRDNGIGMSQDEVIENIGTIARSGTRRFLEEMKSDKKKKQAPAELIGQFGVGFYSSFLVSEHVTLRTRKAGSKAEDGVEWQSDGSGDYQIRPCLHEARGVELTLKLKEDAKEFLEPMRLRTAIKKYSDHLSLPIEMLNTPPPSEDENAPPPEPEWEQVNRGQAFWTRAKRELKDEDYKEFYQTLTYDREDPAVVLHNHIEGTQEYTTLFYIPAKAPHDMWEREIRSSVKLYVRRMFITDDTLGKIMPHYLRFVRGIVDSSDLPLNVSREFLQNNQQLSQIRSASVQKILAELQRIADEDADKYQKIWDQYGIALKYGVVEDTANRDALSKLLRFNTTRKDGSEQKISLDQYVKKMPKKQQAIYYVTAESPAAAAASPHLEVFRKRGIEVLLLSDQIDEWLVSHLREYDEKSLKSIAKGDLDLDEKPADKDKDKDGDNKSDADDKAKAESDTDPETEKLLAKIKEVLGDRVKEVKVSKRLVDSPSCLVSEQNAQGANMERILKSMGQTTTTSTPIMEINPDHPIIKSLSTRSPKFADWAHVLFDQAALASGVPLAEPNAYVQRINRLLVGEKVQPEAKPEKDEKAAKVKKSKKK